MLVSQAPTSTDITSGRSSYARRAKNATEQCCNLMANLISEVDSAGLTSSVLYTVEAPKHAHEISSTDALASKDTTN